MMPIVDLSPMQVSPEEDQRLAQEVDLHLFLAPVTDKVQEIVIAAPVVPVRAATASNIKTCQIS
uniref:Uncharacterized protein n=1 Tax=Arion vulgaris TaxID=1028688 RepID=A0A0B7AVS4_9EUPU